MAVAHVQDINLLVIAAAPQSTTFPANCTVGNVICVTSSCSVIQSGVTLATPSGCGVATWTQVPFTAGNTATTFWYGLVTTPGQNTLTITEPGLDFIGFCASEFSGVSTTRIDQQDSGTTSNVTNLPVGTLTPTAAGQLAYIGNGNNWGGGSSPYSPGSPWTLCGEQDVSGPPVVTGLYGSAAYLVTTSTTPLSPTFPYNGGGSSNNSAAGGFILAAVATTATVSGKASIYNPAIHSSLQQGVARILNPPLLRALGTKVNGTTSLALAQPTGTATGDLLLAFVIDHATTGTSTAPTGWTALTNGAAAATGGRMQTFWAIVGQNGLTGTSWTFSGLTTRAIGKIVGYQAGTFATAGAATPVLAANSARSNASGTTGTTAVTTVEPGTLVLGAFAGLASGNTWTVEATATAGTLAEQSDEANSTFCSLAVAQAAWTGTGSTGASSATMSAAGTNAAVLMAFGPAMRSLLGPRQPGVARVRVVGRTATVGGVAHIQAAGAKTTTQTGVARVRVVGRTVTVGGRGRVARGLTATQTGRAHVNAPPTTAHVQDTANVLINNTATLSSTFPANTTVGNVICVLADCNVAQGSGHLDTPSGAGVTTWTQVPVGTLSNISMWYGLVTTPGSNTVTITPGTSGDYLGFCASEFSGVSATLIDHQCHDATGTAPVAIGSLTPTAVGQVAFIGTATINGIAQAPYTPGSPWTIGGLISTTSLTTGDFGAVAWLITTSTTALTPTYPYTNTGDAVGAGGLILAAAAAAPVTATQTGRTRVQVVGRTATQTGRARIAITFALTVGGRARLSNTNTATQSGRTRVQVVGVAATETGRARIANTFASTVAGRSRVQVVALTATVTGRVRLARPVSATTTGHARVVNTLALTVTARTRIARTLALTTTGRARLAVALTSAQPGKANIVVAGVKTAVVTGVARTRTAGLTSAQPGRARVANTFASTVGGRSRLAVAITAIVAGRARTSVTGLTSTIPAHARLARTFSVAQPGRSRLSAAETATITGVAHLLVAGHPTSSVPGVARVQAVALISAEPGRSRIARTFTSAEPGRSRVSAAETATIAGRARVQVVAVTATTTGRARIANTFALTITGRARLAVARTVTITGVAHLVVASQTTSTVTGRTRVTVVGLTATIPARARIANTFAQTITGRARVQRVALTSTVPGRARLARVFTAVVTGVSRLAATRTATVTGVSHLLVSGHPTISIAGQARVQVTALTSAVTAQARVARSFTSTVTARTRVTATLTSTQPARARLTRTLTATIPAQARLARTLTATIPARTRVSATLALTQVGKANIVVAGSRTTAQPARTRIATPGLVAAVSAVSRLARTFPAPITGRARLAVTLSASVPARARLTVTVPSTVTGRTRVQATATTTVSAVARLAQTYALTVAARARVRNTATTSTVAGRTRLLVVGVAVTVTARARVAHTFTSTVTAHARVAAIGSMATQPARARVQTAGLTATIAGHAWIVGPGPAPIPGYLFWLDAFQISGLADGTPLPVWPDESGHGVDFAQAARSTRPIYSASASAPSAPIGGRARLSQTVPATVGGRSRVAQAFALTVTGVARVGSAPIHATVTGTARLAQTLAVAVNGRARLAAPGSAQATQPGRSRLSRPGQAIVGGRSRLARPFTATQPSRSRLARVNPLVIPGRSRLRVPGRTAAQSGRAHLGGATTWQFSTTYPPNSDTWSGPFVPTWTGLTDTTGSVADVLIDNGVWNPKAPLSAQTLNANSPNNWQVTTNIANGNTEVLTFPYVGADFINQSGNTFPLSSYTQITSSFSESMPTGTGTLSHAMFDIWLNNWNTEVMIQFDFSALSTIEEGTVVGNVSFGGSNGVPVQNWTQVTEGRTPNSFCLSDTSHNPVSEQVASVDILAMLLHMQSSGHLPTPSYLWQIGCGWEMQSTGGHAETYTWSGWTLTCH